jgi:hypothetical protein
VNLPFRKQAQMVAAASAMVVVSGAFAWACIPYPIITVGPRSSGPAGADISVSGVSFAPGQIEVRWNAIDGPVLATASDPDFSVNAKVPEVPEGMYAIVALTRDGDGGVSSLARASFLVARPGSSDADPALSPQRRGAPREEDPNRLGLLLTGGGLVGLGGLLGALAFRRHPAAAGSRGSSE